MKETLTVAVDKEIVDLAQQFLENRRSQKQEWHDAVKGRNIELLRRLGHDLKGTAGAFGFQGLYDSAVELEEAVARDDLNAASDALQRLIDLLDRTSVVPA